MPRETSLDPIDRPDGLYASPARTTQKAASVVALVALATVPTGVIAVLLLAAFGVGRDATHDVGIAQILLVGFATALAAVSAWLIGLVSWRLAILRGNVPVLRLRRDGDRIVVEPVRFGGVARGTSVSTAVVLGEAATGPLMLPRGDHVMVSWTSPWYARDYGGRLFQLRLQSVEGEFSVTEPVEPGDLEVGAMHDYLESAGITLHDVHCAFWARSHVDPSLTCDGDCMKVDE